MINFFPMAQDALRSLMAILGFRPLFIDYFQDLHVLFFVNNNYSSLIDRK